MPDEIINVPAADVKVVEKEETNKGLVRELFSFIWEKKLWWLIPIITILLLVGVVIIAGSNSTVSAFIYAMF